MLAVVQSRTEDAAEHMQTPEVDDVLQWVFAEEQSCVVMAGPGTGKTQLVVKVHQKLLEKNSSISPLILVFNRNAKEELSNRGVLGAQTFHGKGLALCRRLYRSVTVKTNKTNLLLKEMFPPKPGQKKHKYREDVLGKIKHVIKLVQLCKAYALNPDSHEFMDELNILATKHRISADLERQLKGSPVAVHLQLIKEMTKDVLTESIKRASEMIDFADMIYMPVLRGLEAERAGVSGVEAGVFTPEPSGWVIVDECQVI